MFNAVALAEKSGHDSSETVFVGSESIN